MEDCRESLEERINRRAAKKGAGKHLWNIPVEFHTFDSNWNVFPGYVGKYGWIFFLAVQARPIMPRYLNGNGCEIFTVPTFPAISSFSSSLPGNLCTRGGKLFADGGSRSLVLVPRKIVIPLLFPSSKKKKEEGKKQVKIKRNMYKERANYR